MILIQPKGRPHIVCPKCKTNVVWPLGLSAEEKQELADEVRSGPLNGTRWAHSRLGLDLREAKALSLHITREHGKCHRCGTAVKGEVSVCRKCRSANLDW